MSSYCLYLSTKGASKISSYDPIQEWKQLEVTQAFRKELIERYETVKETLINTELEEVKYKQGYLQAYRDIMEVFNGN